MMRKIVIFLAVQDQQNYSYIGPLLNDSVQLLIQAVSNSIALVCNETSDCLVGSQGSPSDSGTFGDTLSSMLLEASFEGESVSD